MEEVSARIRPATTDTMATTTPTNNQTQQFNNNKDKEMSRQCSGHEVVLCTRHGKGLVGGDN